MDFILKSEFTKILLTPDLPLQGSKIILTIKVKGKTSRVENQYSGKPVKRKTSKGENNEREIPVKGKTSSGENQSWGIPVKGKQVKRKTSKEETQ